MLLLSKTGQDKRNCLEYMEKIWPGQEVNPTITKRWPSSRRVNPLAPGGGGGLPYETDGDARRLA